MYELFGIQAQGPLLIAAGLGAAILVLIFNSRIRAGAKFLVRGLVGVASVLVLNILLAPLGLAVGINVMTALVVTLLGLPGIIMLYSAQFFLL